MRAHAYAAIAAASLLPRAMADIDPVIIKGAKFFHKNSGDQFFIQGVAYQQGVGAAGATADANPPDPLMDSAGCARDVPLLQELNTNTIRVYAIDPSQNHDKCMQLLADAGIYVVADLSEPTMSINRDEPQWTVDLFSRYTSVLDAMAKYPNFFGAFAGNEVANAKNNTGASAFVKAAVRDTKAYVKSKGYTVGIGYATNDDADIRENMANYFDCGTDDESIDFYGYNIYSFCGQSSYTSSGYDVRTAEFKNFNRPVFFAEYGCNTPPRLFGDTPLLFSKPMSDVFAGGIVYMYFEEANNFGLVKLGADNTTVQKLPSFSQYQKQITKVKPQGVSLSSYNADGLQPAQCPPVSDQWEAASSPLPPPANPQLCQCMYSSLTCVPKQSTRPEDYGDMFDFACKNGDNNTCAGTNKDASQGKYGAYSMCNPQQQLGWVTTQYLISQKNDTSACDFDGKAQTQKPKDSDSDCQKLVEQAGSQGTGTVQGGGQTTDTDGHAGHLVVPSFDFGLLKIGAYMLGAVFTGFGLVLL